jgi:hypothetical protein
MVDARALAPINSLVETGKSGNFGKVDNQKWANHKFKTAGH